MIKTLMMLILSVFLAQTAFSQASSAPKTSVVAKSDGSSETSNIAPERLFRGITSYTAHNIRSEVAAIFSF